VSSGMGMGMGSGNVEMGGNGDVLCGVRYGGVGTVVKYMGIGRGTHPGRILILPPAKI